MNPLRRWLPELLTAAGLLVAPYVLPLLGFSPDTANRIVVWGLFGIGFDILFGYTGLLSFGQAAFFGTGGFVAAYLLTNNIVGSVLLALALGTLGAIVAGLAVGAIALRRTGIYFAMITVAIAQVFFFLENSPLSDYTGGEERPARRTLAAVPARRLDLAGVDRVVDVQLPRHLFLHRSGDRPQDRALPRRRHPRRNSRQSAACAGAGPFRVAL